jgi:hypothetical protein
LRAMTCVICCKVFESAASVLSEKRDRYSDLI